MSLLFCPAELVHIADMVVQGPGLGEALPAHLACVGLLSGMGPAMLDEILVEGESFVTYLALVRLEVYVTSIMTLERA